MTSVFFVVNKNVTIQISTKKTAPTSECNCSDVLHLGVYATWGKQGHRIYSSEAVSPLIRVRIPVPYPYFFSCTVLFSTNSLVGSHLKSWLSGCTQWALQFQQIAESLNGFQYLHCLHRHRHCVCGWIQSSPHPLKTSRCPDGQWPVGRLPGPRLPQTWDWHRLLQ